MNSGRVLLVENDPQTARAYERALTDAGFAVSAAPTSAAALKAIETGQFDVIVSDLPHPSASRIEKIRRLCERASDIPVILVLDELDNLLAAQIMDAGAHQYLVKPVEPEALERTVARAIRRRRDQPVLPVRSRRGEVASITATDAKNEFGRVMERVMQGDMVVITRHDTPKAVVLSVAEFNAIAGEPGRRLDTLSAEFDALLSRMQTPKASAGMKAAFNASPARLGKAAVTAARPRG